MHSDLHPYVLWPPNGEEEKNKQTTVRRAREIEVFFKGN